MIIKNCPKFLFLLIIFGLINSCSNKLINSCSNNDNNNDWKKFGLNGKVNYYVEKAYEAEMTNGEWERGKIKSTNHHKAYFDNKGSCKWIEYLNKNNELIEKSIQKKESKGITEDCFYDNKGELLRRIKMIHNSKNEIKFIVYDKTGKKITQGTSYFINNRVVKQQSQEFEGNKVTYTILYKYDENRNLIRREMVDEKGKIIFKFEYLAFDKNKNWTKMLSYYSEEATEPESIMIREYEYY